MTAQGVKRKLSAILSADVEGYSRLMAQDEVATVQTLTAYREVMTSLIQQHRGRAWTNEFILNRRHHIDIFGFFLLNN